MEYINYYDLLDTNSITLVSEKKHSFRVLYRYFKLIGRYLNTCIMQYNRIEEFAISLKSKGNCEVSGGELLITEQLFSDIHFLLIAMDRCYSLEAEVYNILFDKEYVSNFNASKEVNDIRLMRNVLEHFEENIGRDAKNSHYHLPQAFIENDWSWLEYQLSTINSGVFSIKGKHLHFEVTMFNFIISNYNAIIAEIKNRYF